MYVFNMCCVFFHGSDVIQETRVAHMERTPAVSK